MGIITFKYDQALSERFIRFPYDLYKNDERWIPTSKKEMRRQMGPDFPGNREKKNDHLHLIVRNRTRVLGRASAFVNHSLKKKGKLVGAIGFFESINDRYVTEDLLQHALSWLQEHHGIQQVLAPVNFDIWHGYRYMTKGFERLPFPGEPYNKPYYATLMDDCGFTACKKWHSFNLLFADDSDFFLPGSGKAYERCIASGYRFMPIDIENLDMELMKLHAMISDSYAQFTAYTSIGLSEFKRLYANLRWVMKQGFCCEVKNRSGLSIGFALLIPNKGDMVRFIRRPFRSVSNRLLNEQPDNKNEILFYLIGIVQKEQLTNKSIGKALYYYAVNNILQRGYTAFTAALMAEGSPLYRHAKAHSNKIISEYVLFDIVL